MTDNELTLNARVTELEKQVTTLQRQLASDQAYRQGIKQVIWRTIIFAIVMGGTAIGTLSWLFPLTSR